MNHFYGIGINNIYPQLIRTIRDQGTLEGKTRDLLDINLTLWDPQESLLWLPKNWKWCFQEAFDRLTGYLGYSDIYGNPGQAYRYRPSWKRKLKKEGGIFDYAYAEPLKGLNKVIELLKKQKGWREAILPVWEPQYLDNQESYQRRPCTLTMHFIIRDNELNLFVNMRSNDVVNLLPYDIFHHTFVQRIVALEVGVKVGEYHHHATHMYYPKRRELNGRDYAEKVSKHLEKLKQQGQSPLNFSMLTRNIKVDLRAAIRHLVSLVEEPFQCECQLIQYMVNFIRDEETKNPLAALKTLKMDKNG